MATKTKAPSGLTITRDNDKFTFSWKLGDKGYTDQQLEYIVSGQKKYNSITVTKSSTSKSATVKKANYFPNAGKSKASIVKFRVRGKKNKKWSDWSYKTFDILVPNNPSLGVTVSEEYSNQCTFSWSVSTSNTTAHWFTDVEWQSILVKDCDETDGSKLNKWKTTQAGWQTGTSTLAESTKTITEDTVTISTGSHTRWFRARARGVQGVSDWRYSKHVYAIPWASQMKSVKVDEWVDRMRVTATWKSPSSAARPIQQTNVEYHLGTPRTGLLPQSGASWEIVNTSKDTIENDAATFFIDGYIGNDQCLWVRVNNLWDGKENIGKPYLAAKGKLSTPTGLNVTADPSTHMATVEATNNSAVEDSFLVIAYESAGKSFDIGVIPHADSSVTVQCPDWGESTISFVVRAVVGSYTYSTTDGVRHYKVDEKMVSNKVRDGGAVPLPPTGVTVDTTDTLGTINVSWNWTWTRATQAIVSWADHEDAWYSTDEPETHTVERIRMSRLNITGLETGKTWYVRVCLSDGETESPWSDIVSINLSSAPNKPSLSLSSAVIAAGNEFSAFWAFVSTDGTNQVYAEICEATVTGGQYVNNQLVPLVITYGNVIAHTESAQQTTINAESIGWHAGETHNLCVRVTSASNLQSEWSDPVSIIIAEPIEATITSTSLIDENHQANPQEYEGDVITIVTPYVAPIVKNAETDIVPTIAGSGTPTPTNKRKISGYTVMNVTDTVNGTAHVTAVDLNGTVYSGHLNITTGELTIDKVMIEFDGTEEWAAYGDSMGVEISGAKINDNVISDRYVVGDTDDNLNFEIVSTDNLIGYGKIGTLTIRR